MRFTQSLAALPLMMPLLGNAQSSPQLPAADVTAAVNSAAASAAAAAVEETTRREFAGLNFGVGLSLTSDVGSTQRVKSASIVDSVVRVDADEDKDARIMLESHYFFLPDKSFMGVPANRWGWGPFVSLQPGTGEIIEAIGLGLMTGFRRPNSDDSWNIGIGYVVDPHVQVLGDGFVANQAPPGTETTVRFRETSQEGWSIIFSFSF